MDNFIKLYQTVDFINKSRTTPKLCKQAPIHFSNSCTSTTTALSNYNGRKKK